MNDKTQRQNKTRELLIKHYQRYPKLQIEDIFKYLYQSAFGCEHLVSDEKSALDYIKREYETLSKTALPLVESLDGEYVRVHLSYLNHGLTAEKLAKLFCESAKKEENGKALLEEKLERARELVESRELPLDLDIFEKKLQVWKETGYPAIHHSEAFRSEYHPAYRVIAKRYAESLL